MTVRSGTSTLTAILSGALGFACATRPPPDFAPNPTLVDRITEIRMHVGPGPVCPGDRIAASYEAVLVDGTRMPFVARYDEDDPPPLHVSFLDRTSAEASPRNDGDWNAHADPLESVMDGFRLRAVMKAKPSLETSAVVEPHYGCLRTGFRFTGAAGKRGQGGRPGPDVAVRLDVLSSPFYDELVVAEIAVGREGPSYVLGVPEEIPPSDWLVITSRGGRGGRGVDGVDGAKGKNGKDGCPPEAGGAGGAGGSGGPGGAGGPGGRITIVVPEDPPFLAGLIDARSVGGEGGEGGNPGEGGPGGDGGKGIGANRRTTCEDGTPGAAGPDGAEGPEGPPGSFGPRAAIVIAPPGRVFRSGDHPVIGDLLDFNRNRRRP